MFSYDFDPEKWAQALAELKAHQAKSAATKKPTGAKCTRCKEFNEYAELDAEGKYRCFQCSKDPFR